MVIIMNISEEKRTQICAALAKAQQDIKRIQAAGVMDISEVEWVYRFFQRRTFPLPGTLHLADLVLGVFLAVILDVPGVQLLQAFLCPCRRVTQLRKHGEKGVTAVPAAQPGAPKSGCMILPEICTDNSGKIQKRR